jgi:hypothetical protein
LVGEILVGVSVAVLALTVFDRTLKTPKASAAIDPPQAKPRFANLR